MNVALDTNAYGEFMRGLFIILDNLQRPYPSKGCVAAGIQSSTGLTGFRN